MEKVALLRGVNVGGRNMVSMKVLAQRLTEVGFAGVRTYLQSGNIFFESDNDDDAAVVHRIIEEHFGLKIPVVVISTDELRRIFSNSPIAEAEVEKQFFAILSRDVPPCEGAVGDDSYIVRGRCAYLVVNPPSHKSKLTNALVEKITAATATTRNYNTIKHLTQC